MASIVQLFLPFLCICFFTFSMAEEPFFPDSVVLPVTKDSSTLRYLTQVHMGVDAPFLSPVKLVIDLEAPFSWVDCATISSSLSQNPIPSCSLQCSMANSSSCCKPSETHNSCTLQPVNPITRIAAIGDLREDIIAVEVTDGLKKGSLASIPFFLFSCAPTSLLNGLGRDVKGMLGLGNTRLALPSQVASTFGFHRRFILCLSSSNGIILSGGNPNPDISRSLLYSPLEFHKDQKLQGYYIKMNSIRINGKKLSINSSLLSIDGDGIGGTKISPIIPYTTMKGTIYDTFTAAYIKAATNMNMTRVSPVAPFGVCFSSKGAETKRDRPNVPIIDLVLQSEMVKWRIHGWNSMVHVGNGVMCLGFLDGGSSPEAAIVIGGHQLEDNFLEFNLETAMLGFSSSLLMRQRSCSDLGSISMSREAI